MRSRLPVALCAGLGLLAGAARADSGSDLVRDTRQVSGFSQVVLRSVADLVITQGEREGLVVEAERRLLPELTGTVQNGVLVLANRGPRFQSQKPVRFLLTVKTISRITDEGSGSIDAGPLRSDALSLVFAGSGGGHFARVDTAQLSVDMPGSAEVAIGGGRAGTQTVRIGGAGQYASPKMASSDAKVVITGSGEVELAVERKLSVAIEGSGMVRYVGNPQVTEDISGAGQVERVAAR